MIFVIAIICGFIVLMVAASKGHESFGWFIYGALLFPIALIHILITDPNIDAGSDKRKCPFCAEFIKSEAKVCRYCGRDIEPIVVKKNLSNVSLVFIKGIKRKLLIAVNH